MGGTSELVDKVNLVGEDEDDDDLVELEDVPITKGTQERTANRRKTSVIWAFFEMLPTKGDDDKPYCKCKKFRTEYLSPSSYGTGNLKRHIKSCYKLFEEYEYLKVRDKLFALLGENAINI